MEKYFNVLQAVDLKLFAIDYNLSREDLDYFGTGKYGQDLKECAEHILRNIAELEEEFGGIEEGQKIIIKSVQKDSHWTSEFSLKPLSTDGLKELTGILNEKKSIFVEGQVKRSTRER